MQIKLYIHTEKQIYYRELELNQRNESFYAIEEKWRKFVVTCWQLLLDLL